MFLHMLDSKFGCSHYNCFRGHIFWWWSVGWYHKCEFLHHEPFRHLSPKTIIVQKPLQQKHAWTWAVEDLNLFGGQPRSCGDFWCMGKKKRMLPAGRDSVVFKINHEYNLVNYPPKECLLVLIFIFQSKHSSLISQGKPSSQTPQFRWWLRCWMCSVATCPKHVPKNVIQLMFCSQGGDPLTDAWN